ncbi:MAG: hypothetical protein WEE89_06485 [Gemmatimonadota bacterium]
MGKAGRVTLAVLAGASVWAVLWNAGTLGGQAALPELMPAGQPITNTGVLLSLVIYGAMLSVLAGYTTVAAAGKYPVPALRILAALQFTLGLVFEISFWGMTPVWYHVVFLAIVIPTTLYGGTLRGARRESARAALI